MKLSEQVAQLEFAKEALQKRVIELKSANQILLDRVEELEITLKVPRTATALQLKLPPVRARLLNMLLENEFVPRDLAEVALTRGGTRKALDVHFSMLRRDMPSGVEIKNKRDAGWYIPVKQKPILKLALT